MARHGQADGGRAVLLQRVGMALAFLVVVAVVPTLLITLPGRDGAPAAAPTGPPTPGPLSAAPTGPSAATTPPPTGTPARPGTAAATTPAPTRSTAPPDAERLPVAAPVADGPPPPNSPFQEFPSWCRLTGTGAQAVPPKGSVRGDWFGTRPGNPATSCLYAGDRSSYWVPAVLQAGTALVPEQSEVYYKSGIRDHRLVQPFPKGLTMLSDTAAQAQAAGGYASWSCGGPDSLTLPTSCAPGQRLKLRLQAPSCWDGARLDSPDHRSHLAWPYQDQCPGGHPVPLPKLEMVVFYPVRPGAVAFSLATGAGPTMAFRFVANWDRAAQVRLLDTCVRGAERCDHRGVVQ